MFFANSLGPSHLESNVQAIYDYVRRQLGNRRTVSREELGALIWALIQSTKGVGTAAGGIKALKDYGYIAAKDANTFELKR
jgi:hypothetical protein